VEDGQDWVAIGCSRNEMRFSVQHAKAGRIAEKLIETKEYADCVRKFVEIVAEEQSNSSLFTLKSKSIFYL